MKWLALDIGGANLKAADGEGYAASYGFPLWRDFLQLSAKLRAVIAEAPPCDHLAVTMTGELADCFASKAEGVRFIIEAVQGAADGRHTRVYLVDGRMVGPPVAVSNPLLAAASNWHALARYVGRHVQQGPAMLIDIGSTTCDIIPLLDGKPVALGADDTERLLLGELVYTGVERSPLCAITHAAPYRGRECPMAQELFATTMDVYLLLGDLREDAYGGNTADGRPATKGAARARIGRMISASSENFHHRDAVVIAQAVAEAQLTQIVSAARRVSDRLPRPPEWVVLAGQGEFLGRRVADRLQSSAGFVSMAREWGGVVSRCAPAHALAVLAREAAER